MNLTHYYWYFQSVIPENICDDITRYAKQLNDEMAVTGAFSNGNLDKKQIKDLKKKRNSSVAWMDDRWIYREIQPYIHKANQSAGWNFQWDFSESCQFTKLSVTVTLSDPKDYKGGELEFDFRDKEPSKKQNVRKCKEILPKGSLVVFPSFIWHRVCPIKSGERNSLVIWNLGYPFK